MNKYKNKLETSATAEILTHTNLFLMIREVKFSLFLILQEQITLFSNFQHSNFSKI